MTEETNIKHRIVFFIKRLAAGLAVAWLTLPMVIDQVKPGLDPSWRYIINLAGIKGLKFGSDIVFTYGPLGFLCTPENIGHNIAIAAVIYLCTSLLLLFMLVRALSRFKGKGWIAFLLSLTLLWISSSGYDLPTEYYFYFLALLSGSLAWWDKKDSLLHFAILCAITISLCFIKFSGVPFSLSIIVLFVVFKWFEDRKTWQKYLLLSVSVPFLFTAAYLIYNPSWEGLATYVVSAFQVSSGYSAAMSLEPSSYLYLALALVTALIFCIIAAMVFAKSRENGCYLLLFSGAMFLIYKNGFVRADIGHFWICFKGFLMIFSVIALFVDYRKLQSADIRKGVSLHFLELLCFLSIIIPVCSLLTNGLLPSDLYRSRISYFSGINTVLEKPYSDAVKNDALPSKMLQIIGKDTVAVYPLEQVIGCANDLNMIYMPVFQAYSAYTPYLDRLNGDFFSDEKKAPEYIVFSDIAIDGRFPLMECPATWTAISDHYSAVYSQNSYLLLKRKETASIPHYTKISSATFWNDDKVEIPKSENPVRLTVSAKTNLLGQIANLFYHLPAIYLNLVYENGTVITGRTIVDNLENGFVINYFPNGQASMVEYLTFGQTGSKVKGFYFSGKAWKAFYQNNITVTFEDGDKQERRLTEDIYGLLSKRIDADPLKGLKKISDTASYCIDYINGIPNNGTAVLAKDSKLLSISGWAVDAAGKSSPGAVYLKIGDGFYLLPSSSRPDVGAYLGNSAYDHCGFDAMMRLDDIDTGSHGVSLIVVSGDGSYYYEIANTFEVVVK
ncbi:MAG TPA: hypothetical protein VN441_08285 [Syntrophomonas sp.]|nr:hypothetical protein [Syntrophomonas sp.]